MALGDAEVLDSTLRDGVQRRGAKVDNVEDGIRVIKAIDRLGYVDIFEAGFAGSGDLTDDLIREAAQLDLNARAGAFGMVRKPGTRVDDFSKNPGIKVLLESKIPVVILVYKSWDYHVPEILRTTLDENLKMLDETIRFFKTQGKEVIADAEFATHAFLGKPQDGIPPNLDYLLQTMDVASNAGASKVVLCDTTGILLPQHVAPLVQAASRKMGGKSKLGFHGHNDHSVGDAITYMMMQEGVTHVQTTFNGLGERTGNGNIVNLLGLMTSPYQESPLQLNLSELKTIAEYTHLLLTGKPVPPNSPFIGLCAFSHKGGMHGDGNAKLGGAYNGRDPKEFGNTEHYPISSQAGTAHIAKLLGVTDKRSPWVRSVYRLIMDYESQGYELDEHPEFFNLLAQRVNPYYIPPFKIIRRESIETSEAGLVDRVKLDVNIHGKLYAIEAEGKGLVDAAVQGVLNEVRKHYDIPEYRLRYDVVGQSRGKEGSSQKTLVHASFILENGGSGNLPIVYTMPGMSNSVIEASIDAILAGIEYAMILKGTQYKNGIIN